MLIVPQHGLEWGHGGLLTQLRQPCIIIWCWESWGYLVLSQHPTVFTCKQAADCGSHDGRHPRRRGGHACMHMEGYPRQCISRRCTASGRICKSCGSTRASYGCEVGQFHQRVTCDGAGGGQHVGGREDERGRLVVKPREACQRRFLQHLRLRRGHQLRCKCLYSDQKSTTEQAGV